MVLSKLGELDSPHIIGWNLTNKGCYHSFLGVLLPPIRNGFDAGADYNLGE